MRRPEPRRKAERDEREMLRIEVAHLGEELRDLVGSERVRLLFGVRVVLGRVEVLRVFDFLKGTGFKEDLDDVFVRLEATLKRNEVDPVFWTSC